MPEIRDIGEWLPRWVYVQDGDRRLMGVGWIPPPFFLRLVEKVCQCPRLKQEIVEQFQVVLDSGQFDIDWIEVTFRPDGIIIDVTGNRCGIFPYEGDKYLDHNVDSFAQSFSLTFLLLTAIREIYSAMVVWEEESEAGLEDELAEYQYRLERSLNSKPFRAWEVKGDTPFCIAGVVLARTWDEARETAEQVDERLRVGPIMLDRPQALSSAGLYRATVVFEDQEIPDEILTIIATSRVDAEESLEMWLEDNPPFFEVDRTEIEEKEPIVFRPLVIRGVL